MNGGHVEIGQRWRRPDGVVVEVQEERGNGSLREVLLVPVEIPAGKRARKSWKWDEAVVYEFKLEGGADGKA